MRRTLLVCPHEASDADRKLRDGEGPRVRVVVPSETRKEETLDVGSTFVSPVL